MTATKTPDTETTIGELVAQRPSRARVFEKLGIDYCCGGKRPLADACAEKGLSADMVLAVMLAAEEGSQGDEQSWASAGLVQLADHIEQTHHEYLKRELPRLQGIVRKVSTVHGHNHPWLSELDKVYSDFILGMEEHMKKEEEVFFPQIRRLEQGGSQEGEKSDTANPYSILEHEHDEAAQSLARMRELSSNYTSPPDACNTFRAMLDGLRELELDTHRHVHKENNILFPRAVDLAQEKTGSIGA